MPVAFVPDWPLSMMMVLEDPVAPGGGEPLVEPVVVEPLVEPVAVEPPVEPVVVEPPVEPDEVAVLEGENWTASAQVVLLLD